MIQERTNQRLRRPWTRVLNPTQCARRCVAAIWIGVSKRADEPGNGAAITGGLNRESGFPQHDLIRLGGKQIQETGGHATGIRYRKEFRGSSPPTPTASGSSIILRNANARGIPDPSCFCTWEMNPGVLRCVRRIRFRIRSSIRFLTPLIEAFPLPPANPAASAPRAACSRPADR